MHPSATIYTAVLTLLLSSVTLHAGCAEKKRKVSTVDAEKRWCARNWRCELKRRKVRRSPDLEAAGKLYLHECVRKNEQRTQKKPALKQKLANCLAEASCDKFLRCSEELIDRGRGEKAQPARAQPARAREVK
ncbi:MAG: hypothetical protein ABI333_21865 [bacterium]